MRVLKGLLVILSMTGMLAGRCEAQTAQATLVWNGPSSSSITGYYLAWGLSSGDYSLGTNTILADTNSQYSELVTFTNASPGEVFYLNVQSYSGGSVSSYANEVVFTNIESATNPPSELGGITSDTNGAGSTPPSPPGGLGTNSGTTNGTTSGTNVASGNGAQTVNTNISQSLFWGVPPFVNLGMSNGMANLSIGGTVGATLMLESTTNIFSMDGWSEVTNICVTNIAPVALTNPPAPTPDALDLAFVPGVQTFTVPANSSTPQYFRVVMKYDYVILASMVLPSKNLTPRLILVNMPGVICDDACYVNESSSFIHIDRSSYALQLEGSGSTIRQIAGQLAGSLNLDWTCASEFSYSNGFCQILATVVETEPASSDPVAGQSPPGPPIVINF
ncbi:MAG TPA: hypothetical protein VH619_10270 [Verrucomicrobiae bacterium]|jgi:hypothetical protein|nr:hypothetical protein [Verrucomicrobiae bacterium]